MDQNKNAYVPGSALRPYDRFAESGPESLSDVELLAIILRKGTKEKDAVALSDEVLHLYGGDGGLLNLMLYTDKDFQSIIGIGPVKAVQLAAISELSKRIWREKVRKEHMTVDSASVAADLYREELRYLYQEKVILLLLDVKRRLIRSVPVSQGTVDRTSISPREIFYETIRHGAAAFIVLHNHPSGNPEPSKADIEFAKILRFTGEIMNIPMLDCMVIGDSEYFSFKEHGLLDLPEGYNG